MIFSFSFCHLISNFFFTAQLDTRKKRKMMMTRKTTQIVFAMG